MKTSNNTILITGGSTGIGLELAKKLSVENQVIIVGRNHERLAKAAASLNNVTYIEGDVSDEGDVNAMVSELYQHYQNLNMLINNAGAVSTANIVTGTNLFEMAGSEILTNYLSTIRLNEKLLPLLTKQQEAAIVHVSSITAFAPALAMATYSASKAALHSYSQSLRLGLANSSVKVFELMPPLVNTDFSAEVGGQNGIPASQVADEFLRGLENDEFEIRVAGTEAFYHLYLSSPPEALKAMNRLK